MKLKIELVHMQEKVLISNLPKSYLSIHCTFKDFSYVEYAYISRVGKDVSWSQVPLKRDTPTEMNKTSRRYLELVIVMHFLGCLFTLWNIPGVNWKWGTTVYRRRLCDLWKQSDSLRGKLTGHPGFCPYERDTLMSLMDDIWASWRVCTGLFNWTVCGG